MLRMWLNRLVMVGLGLLLPLPAPAVTTTPISAVPAVERIVSTYDAGIDLGNSDTALTDSEALKWA